MPVPTPILRDAGYMENLYRGQAMAQLRILKQQMALGGLKIGSRTIDLDSNVVAHCAICFNLEEVKLFTRTSQGLVAGVISTTQATTTTTISGTTTTAGGGTTTTTGSGTTTTTGSGTTTTTVSGGGGTTTGSSTHYTDYPVYYYGNYPEGASIPTEILLQLNSFRHINPPAPVTFYLTEAVDQYGFKTYGGATEVTMQSITTSFIDPYVTGDLYYSLAFVLTVVTTLYSGESINSYKAFYKLKWIWPPTTTTTTSTTTTTIP